jgi:LPS export ABC transporter permease LptG
VRILSRYFFASYLSLFVVVLLVSLIVIALIEMLVHFDHLVEHREEVGGVLAYLLIRVPSIYLRQLIPIASFTAAFLCLGLAARRQEIIALKSGGIPPHRVAVPVLACALLLTGATLVVNETLLLGATREFTRLEHPGQPVVFRRGSFWYHSGDTFYNVQEADRETRTLRGVRIFQVDEQRRLVEAIRAQEVLVLENDHWQLRQASLRRFDPAAPTAPPVIEHLEETVLEMMGEEELALLDAGETTLSLFQLLEAVQLRARDNRDDLRFRAALYARLAEPVTVLVFALLAMPIGLSVERTRNIAVSALVGIAAVAVFHTVWHVATLLPNSGFAAAAIGPWVALIAFAGAGVLLFLRTPR